MSFSSRRPRPRSVRYVLAHLFEMSPVHTLAQMKVGKAKCLNASDSSPKLRPKGVAVGSECSPVTSRRSRFPQVFWDGRASGGTELLAINRTLFPAMQFGRIAGVWALCFASFYLCQQMKGGRLPGEIRRALAQRERPARRAPPIGKCPQNKLAAKLIVNAKMVVLNTNDNSACFSASRRIVRFVIVTSAVCDATAIVNEKYRKSP